jgi:hypothetical protein
VTWESRLAYGFGVASRRNREDECSRDFASHQSSFRPVNRVMSHATTAQTVARQGAALTDKSRSNAAKAQAKERKLRGELPGFMRKGASHKDPPTTNNSGEGDDEDYHRPIQG